MDPLKLGLHMIIYPAFEVFAGDARFIVKDNVCERRLSPLFLYIAYRPYINVSFILTYYMPPWLNKT